MNACLKQLAKHFLSCWHYFSSFVWLPFVFSKAKRSELAYLSPSDFKMWKKAFQSLLRENCRSGCITSNQLIVAFAQTHIQAKIQHGNFSASKPIVVLCVKNDRKRIELLVNHYRKFGIRQFAFLDNGSTDGTYEWLAAQPDVDLYQTFEKYRTFVKEGWINRIVSYYGVNRWYILTDSDELVVYPGMEKHGFDGLLEYARRHGIKRFKALTLDMYSDGQLFSSDSDSASIQNLFCWTDSDSFFAETKMVGRVEQAFFYGGPRWRCMGAKLKISKYPLVFFEAGTLSVDAHYQFPYQSDVGAPCHLAVLHYKFLPEDKGVFEKRGTSDGGFAGGGRHYKKYMEFARTPDATFLYGNSIRYVDSASLKNLGMISPIEF